jgi:hypothetical protein
MPWIMPRIVAVACQIAEYQIHGIYPWEISAGKRLICEKRLPEWAFLYATVGTKTGDRIEYAKLVNELRVIRQLPVHPGCILGMVKFRAITVQEATTLHPSIPLLDNAKHVLLITDIVKWETPLRLVGLPRFDRWLNPSSTTRSELYLHALQMASLSPILEEVGTTSLRRSLRRLPPLQQQQQQHHSATTEFDVAVLYDTTGDWCLGAYRVGNRSVGFVGYYKGEIVSGNAPSGKRIVIKGLPGDGVCTVDQMYVDPEHLSNKTLRHGQHLWSLLRQLYVQQGTHTFIVTNATSKGLKFYLRVGFIVSPVSKDLILEITVTK